VCVDLCLVGVDLHLVGVDLRLGGVDLRLEGVDLCLVGVDGFTPCPHPWFHGYGESWSRIPTACEFGRLSVMAVCDKTSKTQVTLPSGFIVFTPSPRWQGPHYRPANLH
jgi:hypothetical protein